ncbi:integrase [Pseudomonas sp. LS1212]|uniref:integrase n=1 Tax=Pseudomonas sp. LS1212 TaxID=2972478 RepID=UPI00215C4704|nr:integrase [Pseudomonas sp. LS1212]UVJ44856.1 integrase [Pseudomonas sp. LS1212]
MSNNAVVSLPWAYVESQPGDVRELPESQCDALIVSAIQVEGHWVILSRYGDDCWQIGGMPTNTCDCRKRLNFQRVPAAFRAVMKAIMYRYLRRGREGQQRPKGGALNHFFTNTTLFLRYLDDLTLTRLGLVTPIVCTNYAAECREYRQSSQRKNKPLSQGGLQQRFRAVEALYELSQYTHDPIPEHPWRETSSTTMAGLTGSGAPRRQGSKTSLIPDMVFCALFENAYEQVQRGKHLLDLRDAVGAVVAERTAQKPWAVIDAKNQHLAALGWEDGLAALNQSLLNLRTACYIVLACTSGCRNHELTNVQLGAHHRTEDDEGTIFHWMHSKSDKTDTGVHDWMIPEAAVRALRLMERWAEPYQVIISAEIVKRRRINPFDPEIARAQKHRHALFLGSTSKKGNQVRTLSNNSWDRSLKAFSKDAGLDWSLTTHQFRRKFANYVAHSQFGDLRYLREHFAHWGMDMTLGYAMDDGWGSHLDLELYNDIQTELEDIKLGTVDSWLGDDKLAGGYGRSIKRWQRDPANLALFKNHQTMVLSIAESTAIRSNGHAWCTADNDGCIGNTLERTRCGDCNNAVIGRSHLGIYRQLYGNLKELLECRDIGESGRMRVLRDLERCRDVFMQLGYDPESGAA